MLLSGWKEIAAHLRCGTRSAQRWASRGLPVRRVGKGPKPHVVADSELLDAWVSHGGQLRQDLLDTDAIRDKSKRLRSELTAARKDLHVRVDALRAGIKEISEKQATFMRRQKNKSVQIVHDDQE